MPAGVLCVGTPGAPGGRPGGLWTGIARGCLLSARRVRRLSANIGGVNALFGRPALVTGRGVGPEIKFAFVRPLAFSAFRLMISILKPGLSSPWIQPQISRPAAIKYAMGSTLPQALKWTCRYKVVELGDDITGHAQRMAQHTTLHPPSATSMSTLPIQRTI